MMPGFETEVMQAVHTEPGPYVKMTLIHLPTKITIKGETYGPRQKLREKLMRRLKKMVNERDTNATIQRPFTDGASRAGS